MYIRGLQVMLIWGACKAGHVYSSDCVGDPWQILNDRVPEEAESFQVVLLDQITGGAILGSPTSCVVTIEPSDDPYGNFGRKFMFETNLLIFLISKALFP